MDSIAIFSANYLFLFLLFLALVWFVMQPRQSQLAMAARGIFALPIMYLLLVIAGMIYNDPRPFVSDHFTPLIQHDPDNGFPSDHTLLCSATATIVFFFNKKFSSVLWLLTALVGISRVYTGLHHPLDILTSGLMAFAVGYLVWHFAVPGILASPPFRKIAGILCRPQNI